MGITGLLVTRSYIPHSEGEHLVVGEKYEMYAPAAKQASQGLSLVWHDDVGFSFTYAGTIEVMGEIYIVSPDVHYGDDVPAGVLKQFEKLANEIGGAYPVCPAYIARKLIRPVT